jgi:hypothetical protein
MGSYHARPEPPVGVSRAAKAAKTLTSRTHAKLYIYETLLQRLPPHLQDMAAALGEFIQKAHAMVGPRPLTRHGHGAAPGQPRVRDGVVGARNGRVVTSAVRSPVRPATRWRLVVSSASTSVMARRIVVSRPGQHRRASSRRAEQGDIMGITTVFGLPEHATLDDVPVHGRPLTPPRPARLTALYPAGPA